MATKMEEGEARALIWHYGTMLSQARGGIGGCSRSDIIEWAGRVAALAKQMKAKNSAYLRDDAA